MERNAKTWKNCGMARAWTDRLPEILAWWVNPSSLFLATTQQCGPKEANNVSNLHIPKCTVEEKSIDAAPGFTPARPNVNAG